MRLVVDTSVIISSLIKDSISRRLILHPDMGLFTPEYVNIEIERHTEKIRSFTGLSRNEFNILLGEITSKIEVFPIEEFESYLDQAYSIMKNIDVEDTSFLALALSIKCDGIWSNDSDFDKQGIVKVWKTHELKRII